MKMTLMEDSAFCMFLIFVDPVLKWDERTVFGKIVGVMGRIGMYLFVLIISPIIIIAGIADVFGMIIIPWLKRKMYKDGGE